MKGKSASESSVELAQMMYPEHANPSGNVHGGHILKLVDQAAAIVAARHTHLNVVTASLDRMDFIAPAYVGNLVFAKASLNFTGRTSMEIGVRIEAECLKCGTVSHIGSAYLTIVALDENDKPTEIAPITPQSEEEKRRFEEAKTRREQRLKRIPHHKHTPELCIHKIKR